jgi:hypothetical protein
MSKKAKTNTEETVVVVGSKGKLGVLLGCSVISVMRAMGKHGWTVPEITAAVAAQVGKNGLELMPKEHTIKLACKRGRDEAKGIDTQRKVADLSKKALEALRVTPKAPKGKGKAKVTHVEPAPEERMLN